MSNVNTRITFLDNGHDACCKLSADAGMKEEFEKVSAKKQVVGGCCYRDYVHHSNEQEKKRNEKER